MKETEINYHKGEVVVCLRTTKLLDVFFFANDECELVQDALLDIRNCMLIKLVVHVGLSKKKKNVFFFYLKEG